MWNGGVVDVSNLPIKTLRDHGVSEGDVVMWVSRDFPVFNRTNIYVVAADYTLVQGGVSYRYPHGWDKFRNWVVLSSPCKSLEELL